VTGPAPRGRLNQATLQGHLVVRPAESWQACPINESPERGLPGLHVRIVAVPRTSTRVRVPAGRSQLLLNGVRHCLNHAVPSAKRAAGPSSSGNESGQGPMVGDSCHICATHEGLRSMDSARGGHHGANAWAVGGPNLSDFDAVILHWNGTAWSRTTG
jgi:hypothetical protein